VISFFDDDITQEGSMIRTVIGFEPEDKAWLDRQARREKVPMAELVRRAVRRMRQEQSAPSLSELLEASRGTWKGADGLAHQRALREEW
jgi:hypothetical protein